jgi:flagellar hook-associated protein 3 FlgL
MMRVTQGLMVNRVLANLSRQTRKILTLQDNISSGLRVNRPSDDPLAARLGINLRTAIGRTEQYLSNINQAGPQLEETATAIGSAMEYLHRVNDLTLQGASGTNSQIQRDNIATEMNQILEGLLTTANHQTNGRYIFAGSRTQTPAFEATRNANGEIVAVTYRGNDERTSIAVGEDSTVVAGETGADVFMADHDVFQLIINIRDDLRSGNTAALGDQRITEIKETREQFLQSLARVGAVQNRLEQLSADMEGYVVEYKRVFSENIEADYTETLVNLNAQSNAYQAALNAAARVMQPSLLDFVR